MVKVDGDPFSLQFSQHVWGGETKHFREGRRGEHVERRSLKEEEENQFIFEGCLPGPQSCSWQGGRCREMRGQ